MTKQPKMRHCWNCGAEIGVYADWRPSDLDDCGSAECQRETRSALRAERDEAHEQLDRDMGW